MNLLQPVPPPYDPLAWQAAPFAERARMACQAWAMQGYGTPLAVYAFYIVKLLVYVAGWLFFCSLTPALGPPAQLSSFWLAPLAFQKAILWSMLFEGLGLGCGSGPLTGHNLPPFGGMLYFARPGTTKLPLCAALPVLGGTRRTRLDVALYLMLVAALLRALCAPSLGAAQLWPIAALVPLLGVADKTLFLAFRSEHYWTTTICFLFAGNWIAGAKAVQLALWFWAGFSKLNQHFPAVVCVMTSNSPFTNFAWLRRAMYRRYPDDLRPSRFAALLAHAGVLLELGVPIVLGFSRGGGSLVIGMAMMLALHAFITSNVPLGVPIEWNVMVVYGAFALFWAHPDVTVAQLGFGPLALFLCTMLIGIPLFGNLWPARCSFLLAMRYYAGNWESGVWLFRADCQHRLERLTTSAPAANAQLERIYDSTTVIGLASRVMAFRLMHLHGRALQLLLPKAVERLEDYEYVDGELIAGHVLGWNFGDGQLHSEQLLRAVQAQCGFEPGELRCVFVGSQPLGRGSLRYRIMDAATGVLEAGELRVAELRALQPWAASAPLTCGAAPAHTPRDCSRAGA